MKNLKQGAPQPTNRFRWELLLAAGVVVVLLIAILVPRRGKNQAEDRESNNAMTATSSAREPGNASTRRSPSPRRWNAEPGVSAEETVTRKVNQFTRNRREVLRKWAEHLKVKVPDEYDRFFDVAEAGNWDDLHNAFEALQAQRKPGGGWTEEMSKLWPVVNETYSIAKMAHDWPSQQLLDYGQSILGALRPDMVYVGGTDPGRFIPTLLNETSDGDRHIVLTQNALADGSYLDYVSFLYSDRLKALTTEDSQRGFQDYVKDATSRLAHDQTSPQEPRQIKPGESVEKSEDGKIQISGQVAVMAINELLVKMLMGKNPELSFAIEQSFPLKSLYPNTSPLGPIMEIGKDGSAALTPELASQSVDYWNTATRQLLSDLAVNDSLAVRQAYSKLVAEQATLLFERNYPAQAEENYRLANQICPSSPEAVFNYVNLLATQGRVPDAIAVAENATKAAPNNAQFASLLQRLQESGRRQ